MNGSVRHQDSKAGLRWLERLLLLIGVLCLGAFAYVWLDTQLYQYRENRRLDEALNAVPGSRQAAPAAETDSLGSFRDRSAEQGEPLAEGSLVGRIEIPRLGVSAIVLEGVGKTTLRRAAGHIPKTAFPGRSGNVGIAAHRDSFFRALKDIGKNDTITLKTLTGTYRYRVEWAAVVRPEDTYVLAAAGAPTLTLVTCYPFYYVGAAPKRFIVRARQIAGTVADDGQALR